MRAGVVGHDLASGRTVELSSAPNRSSSSRRMARRPTAFGRCAPGRAGRLPGRHRPVPGPHARRSRRSPCSRRRPGERHAVGSDVDVAWPPNEALVLAAGDRRRRPRHDRSHTTVRASTSRRRSSATWSRTGSRGAICSSASRSSAVPRRWPRSIAACTSSGGNATAAPLIGGRRRSPRRRHRHRPRLRRRPSLRPRPSSTSSTGPTTLPTTSSRRSSDQYGVKVTQSFFSTTDEMYAKLGDDGGDYDISFPISVDVPNMIQRKADREARQVVPPEHRQPRAGVVEPGLRPGQRLHGPVHVVDDGRRLRPEAHQGRRRRARRPSGTPRWKQHISMLDDWQEVFGLTLIQQGHSANTDEHGRARRGAGAASSSRSRWSAPTRPTPSGR